MLRPFTVLFQATCLILLLLFSQGQPWRWWWTLGKPMPVAGQVWCAPWDSDPWHREKRRYRVLEVKDGWIRYGLGEDDGFPSTSELWIFRANYQPCG